MVEDRGPRLCHLPGGAKDVHRLREDIVVDEPGVDGKDAHQEDDITTVEEVVPYLVVRLSCHQLLLFDNHVESKAKHDDAVASISKHDGKEEWEGDDGEDCRVGLSVRGDSVGVDESLDCLLYTSPSPRD